MASTTTTTLDLHRGAVLPFARLIVVAVPVVLLTGFAFLRARSRR